MAWDRKARGDRRGYYYRSVRVGGEVRKVYLGRGDGALAAARQVEGRHEQRQALRRALLDEQAEVAQADDLLRQLHALLTLFVEAVLHDAGYHSHHGSWRRRRHGDDGNDDAGGRGR